MKIALAQINPRLGDVKANVEKHLASAEEARQKGADVVCFPELSLTGYYLRDLTAAVALRPESANPVFARLLEASRAIDMIVGFVEETPRYLFYNSAAYLSGGRVVHIHRKVYLPTYGMFDEQRFMATGDSVRSFETPHGRFCLLVCEDLWHLSLPYLGWLDGADFFVGLTASPGRGIQEGRTRLSTAEVWRVLGQALAGFLTSYVALVNRVGYEDGVSFFGGSFVADPTGTVVAEAADLDEDLVVADLDFAQLRRARTIYPLLRDERPELTLRELQRILIQRGQGR